MTTVRIDQLTAHSRSLTSPFDRGSVLPVRDPNLASDNTKKLQVNQIAPFPRFNVQDYGADPTHTVDSTAAFQAAINAAGTSGFSTVWVPHGWYSVTHLDLPEGTDLCGEGIGNGASVISQPDGTNQDLITITPDQDNYAHWTRVRDLQLLKGVGGASLGYNDTVGSAIRCQNQGGEGTKFSNLLIIGFPEYGIVTAGAITLWFQDLHIFLCGSYGLALFNIYGSWTGHYVLGCSGDGNGQRVKAGELTGALHGQALIAAIGCNVWITGVKAEINDGQIYAVELKGGNEENGNWAILNEITCSGNATGFPFVEGVNASFPEAVVHLAAGYTPYNVWFTGLTRHGGAPTPKRFLLDDTVIPAVVVPYSLNHMFSFYSGQQHAELMHAHPNDGVWTRTLSDPPVKAGLLSFDIGHTNGVGQGASGNVTALQKGAATNAPTSLVVNKWVRANLDGVQGWVPFFT